MEPFVPAGCSAPVIRCLICCALALAATPAFADIQSEVRRADQRVVEQRRAAAQAIRTGDAATIAAAQAKLRAAQAVAWGRRHPARAPVQVIAR